MKKHTLEDTTSPNIKRVVDLNGNWTHYFIVDENRYVKSVTHITSLGYPKGPRFMQYLANSTPEEIENKLLTAGNEGSKSHTAISDLIKGLEVTKFNAYLNRDTKQMEQLTMGELENLIAFSNWQATYLPQTISNEETVHGDFYGGTLDWFGTVQVPDKDKNFPEKVWGKRVLILPDWKTGSGIYPDYGAQASAYFLSKEVQTKYKDFIKAFNGRIFTGVVRLGSKHKSKFEMEVFDATQTRANFEDFKKAYNFALKYEPEWEPDFEEIPESFKLDIPKAVLPVKGKRGRIKKTKTT